VHRGTRSDRPAGPALNPVTHRRREHAVPGPRTAPRTTAQKPPAPHAASDVIRWAAFCCVLVPAVLILFGVPLAAAVSTALGLAAVTAACRALLRQSERGAARLRADETVPHRGRHSRTGTGAHRGGRHTGGNSPVG
jgi:hypothetical protein